MKTSPASLALLPLLFLAASDAAFAGSGGASVRGGAVAVWLKGRWQIKDVLAKGARGGDSLRLAESVRRAIADDVRPLVSVYAGAPNGEYWNLVLDEAADYRLVDRLPCPTTGERLAPGERNLGCTLGRTTYFLRDLFARFDNRTRVLAILHERAHALDPSDRAHDWIQPFVGAVDVLLGLAADQEKDKWRALETGELDALERLATDPEIARRLETPSDPDAVRVVSARGGGLILSTVRQPLRRLDVRFDETSYLGVGSVLDFSDYRCGIPEAMIAESTWLADRTRVRRSRVECAVLENARVDDSTLARTKLPADPFQHPMLVRETKVIRSRVVTPATVLIVGSSIERSELHYGGILPGLIEKAKIGGALFFTPTLYSEGPERWRMRLRFRNRAFVRAKPENVVPTLFLEFDSR